MTTTTFPPHGMEQFTKSKPRRMADEVSVTPKDSISNDLLIPESMLSMAKDSRYIQQCQNLLLQVIEPIIGRYDSQSRSRLEKATWFLSCIIYTVFVIAPTGRTLGMEVCGLSFTGVTKRSRLVGSLLALATGAFAFDFISNRNTNDSAASQEALRGRDRRQIHENLRRQMLQRASSQSISSPSSTDHPSDRSQTESFQTRTFRFISKSIMDAISHLEGPHYRYTNQAVVSTFSVATWIIRLHLAQYCVTGKYPSILHRFLGLEHDRHATRIAFRPNLHRAIAVLIGIQASSTLTRYFANWFAKQMAVYLESSKHAGSAQSSSNTLFPDDNRKGNLSLSPKSMNTCAICRMDRSHPAAPSSCGHVCCWDCLVQWVSTVRPECPLCRAPCRPQDILALYNYEAPSSQEK